MRLFVLLFLLASFQLHAQPTVLEGKIPAWVTQHEYNSTISDTNETSNGYAYLLISKQTHLESKEHYSEYVAKVTSENGLSIVSVINEYFDPSFQTLTFHKLNIIRNGKKINKLNPARFDVIRREDEMERAVYDKSVNAVYNLPDVRVGDIVEYSFTKKGFNPVFNNHRFGTFYLQHGIPVGKFAYKIVYDSQRKIQFKSFGNIAISAIETEGRLKATEWIRENVPALLTDDQYPSWFDPYPHVQYSDFQSWNEVKQWAIALYSFPKLKNSELKETIESIRASGKTDEAKIKECIRIAQGEIRYLSFSDGINGYKPHSPETVYAQRYGDCKDKSFMLALMLNELGIESKPALVSTENGYTLGEMLPNPWAFDHCIVQFTHNDSTYWIDPTLNAQVGPLKSYFFPSYHNALVINNDQSSLSAIPFGYKNASLDIKEEYSMKEVGGYVTLKVNTTYRLDEADEIRSYFKSSTTEQINKDYLNFYARDYADISVAKDFEYTDDEEANIITSSERYLIKDFWKIKGDNKSADIFASYLAMCLRKPETRVRTMPLAITHPRNISQTIKIRLPEEWDVEDSDIEIESDAFIYKRSKLYSDKILTLRYQYSTKASFIAADNVADHIDKIDQVLEDNGLTIFKPRSTKTDESRNAYIIMFLVLAAGIYVIKNKFSR
jgi:transglutaminase-like putative cysteine protease